MKIKRLKVSNFKTFSDLDISLSDFNVLIGANGSGKSNFISIFRFLRDLEKHGLEDAISLQGGSDYFLNFSLKKNNLFSISIELESIGDNVSFRSPYIRTRTHMRISVKKIIYTLKIEFLQKGKGIDEIEEEVIVTYDALELDRLHISKSKTLGEMTVKIISTSKNKSLSTEIIDIAPELKKHISENDIIPDFLRERLKLNSEKKTSILSRFLSFTLMRPLFEDIAIYDFDPKSIKQPSPLTAKLQLEENAKNIAVVLKNLLSQEKNSKKFTQLISNILPFLKNINVKEPMDKSLRLEFKESYVPKKNLPAELISDGTAFITAIIVALFFEKSDVAIFEEPERNLHPKLIRKLVDYMKDVSKRKQIIVTTHNTELIKNLEKEDILFISRKKDGVSQIERLQDIERIKLFLENEIGIDELFADDLIGV